MPGTCPLGPGVGVGKEATPVTLPGARVGMAVGRGGATVVELRYPGTHLGVRQQGSLGSEIKVQSGGRV
jgi:hypothetical protein